jgi:GDP-L-fucose synthase
MVNLEGKKVWVAGASGMVGSAIVRRIKREACVILAPSRKELDLTRQQQVEDWVAINKPDVVFLASAKVGGIVANRDYPADFAYINQVIQSNVIHSAFKFSVEKLVFLGSACMYPRDVSQPLCEDQIMTSALEPTNEAYGVAKIAGMQLCQSYRRQHGADFITVLPTNSYGPCDNYDLETSHVPAALMVKCHNAKIAREGHIEVWGSGTPTRDFLHVDDMADGIVELAVNYSDEAPVNLGSGTETSIRELAMAISEAVGFQGDLQFDASKPDGAPRKLLDNTKMCALGWEPKHSLLSGMEHAYEWYKKNVRNTG